MGDSAFFIGVNKVTMVNHARAVEEKMKSNSHGSILF
jgi:hypothetical protein